ncbi:MAG: hypothetical protein GY953_54055, partial [bacterium]|nr:hypothetical protein [bacterium]
MTGKRDSLTEALRWALENTNDPTMAAADWLARDIDPNARNAVDLVSSPFTSLEILKRAKSAFKTMCVV